MAKELIGDDILAEMVPFSFGHKDKGEEIKTAYIPNLWEKIEDPPEWKNDNHKKYNYNKKKRK